MSIHFRAEGSGETVVVLIHGLGASHRVFDSVITSSTDLRFLAIDLPRSGASGAWAANEPYEIAKRLITFLDEQRAPTVRLFGHSFGGLVAIALASLVPDRVKGLTVASAPALGIPPEARLFLDSPMAAMSTMWMTATPLWRPMVTNYLRWLWGRSVPFRDEVVEHYLSSLSAHGFAAGMVDSLRAVGKFKLPDLTNAPFSRRVLWGERDPLVSVIQGEQLARAIGGELIVLPEVGHCLPEEAPAAVVESVR